MIESVRNIDLGKINNIRELFNILPNKGRLQFNSVHMIPYREKIMEIVDKLLESKELKETYNKYENMLSKYDGAVTDVAKEKYRIEKQMRSKS